MKKQVYIAAIRLFLSVIFLNLFISNVNDDTIYHTTELVIYNFKQLILFLISFISGFTLIISLGGIFYGEE
jgi:hypothetical protein